MNFQTGDKISDYIIEQFLGEGGFGQVFRVRNPIVDKPFALKILRPHVKELDEAIVSRFVSEIKILLELNHQKVVRIFHAGYHDTLPYFVMEYLPYSLADVIGDVDEQRQEITQPIFRGEEVESTFSLERAMAVARQLVEVLAFIHSRNLVHRDLKPSNILLHDKDSLALKLCDFGIAKMLGTSFSTVSTGDIFGSSYYSAREVLRGMKDVDGRADVYSLGVILYRLLTGEVPMGIPEPLEDFIPDVPGNVSEAIMRAMQMRVDRRMGNVVEFGKMLFERGKEKKVVPKPPKKDADEAAAASQTKTQNPKEKKEEGSRKELPKEIKGKDGAEMMLIPAGEFDMGSNDYDDAKPVHTVYLDAFYMDKYEVTNEQYAQFLNDYGKNTDAAGHKLIAIDSSYCLIEKSGNVYRAKSGYEKHPVVVVSWYGAAAYAQFYGKRLPTEAQWEKAARGGLKGKKYPWGGEIDPSKANYNHDSRGHSTEDMMKYLKPVGSFPPNGYGLYDMAGNVWEWCADEYDENYYSKSPKNNPTGPGTPVRFVDDNFTSVKNNTYCVLRGGSWYSHTFNLRCATRNRYFALNANHNLGFRCSQDL